MILLEASSVNVRLGDIHAVRDASLAVNAGEVVALLGPNGAGKSTLMRAMAGLRSHTGSVRHAGTDLARMDAMTRARSFAWLPQERLAHWPMPVADLVMLGRLPHVAFAHRPGPADFERVEAAMAMMQVDHLRARPADALSGGELARALIARAIAQDTPLIMADEPAAGLDPAHQLRLMGAFRQLANGGRGILVSIHDIELAARWADRIVLMKGGSILADGPASAALTPKTLDDVFGISAHFGHDDCGMTLTPLAVTEARP